MDIVQELQQLKEDLVREIDTKIEQMVEKLREDQSGQTIRTERLVREYESIYPLSAGTGIFKGKRPTSVLFADGTRRECPTWKRVMEEILRDCCQDPGQHQALMNLRGKILGRNRVLLGSEAGSMRSPVKIDEALYVETHYDAETLLRILTTRILDAAGYDYTNIRIAVHAE